MRDVVDVAHTGGTRDLGGILLVLVELGVDVFRHLRERVPRVLRPEEVLRVQVVRTFLPLRLRVIGLYDDAVEVHGEAVRYEGLIGPAVCEHGG